MVFVITLNLNNCVPNHEYMTDVLHDAEKTRLTRHSKLTLRAWANLLLHIADDTICEKERESS